jgi:hypothetical protein
MLEHCILASPRTIFFEGALPPIIPRGLRPVALLSDWVLRFNYGEKVL